MAKETRKGLIQSKVCSISLHEQSGRHISTSHESNKVPMGTNNTHSLNEGAKWCCTGVKQVCVSRWSIIPRRIAFTYLAIDNNTHVNAELP